MRPEVLVRLTDARLDPSIALGFVADPAAGATVLFMGTVRDHSSAGDVKALSYEAWQEVAVDRLRAIAEETLDRWGACKVALLHRSGHLEIGDVSVIVCCSAPHRTEAFEAARQGIERIKTEVPIWKKERLTTGEAHWVMGS